MENVDKKEEGLKQTIIINQTPAATSNGLGVAGFVCALVGLVFCWVPVFNWIMWALGLILSACGMMKQPKGLAIAGLVVSLIGLIIMILMIAVFAAAVSAAM